MKLVLGFFCSFAAEHRAIVGELSLLAYNPIFNWLLTTYFLEMASVKKKFLIGFSRA